LEGALPRGTSLTVDGVRFTADQEYGSECITVCSAWSSSCSTRKSCGQQAANALRADLTAYCLSLDMPFHDARTPGEMIERVEGDVAALANFFSRFVLSLGASGLMLFGVLAQLFHEDWRIGMVFTMLSGAALLAMERVRT
jgi:ABC-type multidrug transport system fused ATPase/permease subunit